MQMNSIDIDNLFREVAKLKNPDCVPRRYNPAKLDCFDAVRIHDRYVEKRYGKALLRVRVEQFAGRYCVLSREQAQNISDIARTYHGRIATELDWRRVTTKDHGSDHGTCRHSLYAPRKDAFGVDMKHVICADQFELVVEQTPDTNYMYMHLKPAWKREDWPEPEDTVVYECSIDDLADTVKRVKAEEIERRDSA
jgi:hypothetical protein